MNNDPRCWLVWSNEHRAWWRDGAHGYCVDIFGAGLFTEEDARSHASSRDRTPGKPPPEVAVHAGEDARVALIMGREARRLLAGAMGEIVQAIQSANAA